MRRCGCVGGRLLSGHIRSGTDSDTSNLLPDIRVPTLLLWGDSDRRSPLTVAERFRGAIPHADLAVIPNAGHVSNMEQPAEFNAQVRRSFDAKIKSGTSGESLAKEKAR